MATAKTAQQSGAAQPQQPQQQQQSLPGLDKNMAVRCVEHAQTYWEILEALPSTKVHLTRVDDDLYHDFCQAFPEFVVPQQEEESGSSTPVDPVTKITEQQVKSAELQPRWHTLATQYQDKISGVREGTLIRNNAKDEYTQFNTMFLWRLQFYCFEIARNRRGINDWIYAKEQQKKQKATSS